MSTKLKLILSAVITTTILLAACAPAAAPTAAPTTPVQPTTTPDTTAVSTAAPIQPTTTVPAATAAPVQPTSAPAEVSQGADPCGGTGGNGQLVSVGNNEFTMKRNDNGSEQIIHLSNGAPIKTSTGTASLSDLKIGYRVTLVGGPNPDGSFTADFVFVCN